MAPLPRLDYRAVSLLAFPWLYSRVQVLIREISVKILTGFCTQVCLLTCCIALWMVGVHRRHTSPRQCQQQGHIAKLC